MRRRTFLASAYGALLMAIAGPAMAQTVPPEKLSVSGPLGDKVLGNPNAPVTIIEYASLTCGFCMRFHMETWPALKAKYVDTGKVQFIIREFPLDPLAMGAAMLARCSGNSWYEMTDMFYRNKEEWAHSSTPVETLRQLVARAGMPGERFEECLKDNSTFEGLKQVADRAKSELGVNSTPTFFINGRKEVGALTLDQFDKILGPLLAPK